MTKDIKETKVPSEENKSEVKSDSRCSCGCGCIPPMKTK